MNVGPSITVRLLISDSLGILQPEPEKFRTGVFDYLPLNWSDAAKLVVRESTEPRFDAIIRIAVDFGDDLRQLAKSPRKVLRRKRKKTPLARVQQLDPACLAWLVRQPGRTAVEKAGASQEIYAIVREEYFDTLENRVLKELIRLCERRCRAFLDRNKNTRYTSSERYRLVLRFHAICKQALKEPAISRISRLDRIPQPNYVLQFDPTYRKVWRIFLELMHREQEVEQAWMWQGRLWADIVRLFIASSIQNLGSSSELGFKEHLQSRLLVRRKSLHGRRLADGRWPQCREASFGTGQSVVIDCFDLMESSNSSLPQCARIVGIESGADFIVYFTPIGGTPRQDMILCIWAIHATEEGDEPNLHCWQTQRAAVALANIKRAHGFAPSIRGYIVRSNVWNAESVDLRRGKVDGIVVEGLRLSGDPDNWRGALVSSTSQYIAECALACLDGE